MLTETPSRHAAALREATRRARRLGRPVLASWTAPASHEALSFFGQAAGSPDRAIWMRPSSGEALVGVGAACALTASGPGRFQDIAEQWRELLAEAVVDGADGESHAGPMLLGGFSFDPARRQRSEAWAAFPDARLVLPQRMLVTRDGATWLTHNLVIPPDAAGGEGADSSPWVTLQPPAHRQRWSATFGASVSPQAAESVSSDLTGADRSLSPAEWQALVGSVARAIGRGELGLQKVVLARAEEISHAGPIDPQLALRKLVEEYPGCTVFAIAHRAACFLGATPERLIALRGGTASTLALAGSLPRGATPAEDLQLARRLMQDPKERAEHAIVVAAVREALAEVCARVVADAQPRLKQLNNVQHLLTPIRGQVAAGIGILDLVERLHPTPAVGGFPTAPALALIRERELLDRGWYAGPIGWMNGAGEGEFVVGIRSALLHGSSATLFAGCGIVADSDPAAEYAESGWKLQPMLAALGLAA